MRPGKEVCSKADVSSEQNARAATAAALKLRPVNAPPRVSTVPLHVISTLPLFPWILILPWNLSRIHAHYQHSPTRTEIIRCSVLARHRSAPWGIMRTHQFRRPSLCTFRPGSILIPYSQQSSNIESFRHNPGIIKLHRDRNMWCTYRMLFKVILRWITWRDWTLEPIAHRTLR